MAVLYFILLRSSLHGLTVASRSKLNWWAIGVFADSRTPMFALNPRCLIDQTRAALAGEIAPEPLVLHAALILQLRQEHDVNKRPDEPRNNSRELDSA